MMGEQCNGWLWKKKKIEVLIDFIMELVCDLSSVYLYLIL